ncbi:radical SAM protein [Flexibacterium corallicola]|uniref:radical SAM protein n=1 Tax=Flexibacterium corallicola TaxID=3037259 RepID=UPI00286F9179|nr:radical SAM protein [Pseudovibrio sp. M1P-2-3]
MGINVVIIKPTKFCNAQCTYCSAPPEANGAPKWSQDRFRRYFDKLAPHLNEKALLLFHGGEPMLMGPDFYWKAWEYVRITHPNLHFSMQTNILGYESSRWKDLLKGPFKSSVSTSYDPDGINRTYKGSGELYGRIFWKRLDSMLADGFHPKVIGTYTNDTIATSHEMYDTAKSYDNQTFDIRVNYRYPAGRDHGSGEMLSPDLYGKVLIELYDRWIADMPSFDVTPVDEMFKAVVGLETARCPWTRTCGGRFLGVEPNGDVYNCSEFADLGDTDYCFGNLETDSVDQMLMSGPAKLMRLRRIKLPVDCTTCSHFKECGGGCMRDAVLYGRGLGGKFYYCWSWKQVFAHIKNSILDGRADAMIGRYQLSPATVKSRVGMDWAV